MSSKDRIPTVSVLMTAYNRAGYIRPAIESVLAQTFEDFELIVVDDNSRDDTVAIARSYAAKDVRVRVFVNPSNLGDYPNRNHAASLARGRFLKFHDSDDCLYPHALGVMVPLLSAEPTAAFALSAHRNWPGGPCPMLLTPRLAYEREFLGIGMFNLGPAGALFRAEFFRQFGGFQNVGVGSDFLFWLRACARHNVLLVPGDLYWYRIHTGQELRNPKAAREYASMSRFALEALSAPECPLTGPALIRARKNAVFGIAKAIYRDLQRGEFGLALFRARQSRFSVGHWLRYLRKPRRDPALGSPTGPDGDYLIPDWSHYYLSATE